MGARFVRRSAILCSLAIAGCYQGLDGVESGGAGAGFFDTDDELEASGSSLGPRGEDDLEDETESGGGSMDSTDPDGASSDGAGSSGGSGSDDPTDDPDEDDLGEDEPDDDEPDEPEPEPVGDVPNTAHCAIVSDWSANWTSLEVAVLEQVNIRRAQGANCGPEGNFGPAAALTMEPRLRCAARRHSRDMALNGFMSHTGADGSSAASRATAAGYTYTRFGENVASGHTTAQQVVNEWMGSPGHCRNIMHPDFVHIGVGYQPAGLHGTSWTQKFGRL